MKLLLCLVSLFFTLTCAASDPCTQQVIVQKDDTAITIANRYNVVITEQVFKQLNPNVTDWNMIFPGQTLNIPCSDTVPPVVSSICTQNYTVQPNDNIVSISQTLRIPVDQKLFGLLNPRLANLNALSPNSVIVLPCSPCLKGYQVKQGDTVFKIAKNLHVQVDEISFYVHNPNVTDWNAIFPDQELFFPCSLCRRNYTVAHGDTVLDIAAKLHVFINEQLFLTLNDDVSDWSSISVGQLIHFPCSSWE